MGNIDLSRLDLSGNGVIIAICVVIVFFCLLLWICSVLGRKRKSKRYLETFQKVYENEGNVSKALESASDEFRKKSREAEAIRQALFYLDHSIFRDYETAFDIVEEQIKGRKVKEYHTDVIEKEKAKKSRVLLLVKKD